MIIRKFSNLKLLLTKYIFYNKISSTLILNDVLTHLYVQMPKHDKLMKDQNKEIASRSLLLQF